MSLTIHTPSTIAELPLLSIPNAPSINHHHHHLMFLMSFFTALSQKSGNPNLQLDALRLAHVAERALLDHQGHDLV